MLSPSHRPTLRVQTPEGTPLLESHLFHRQGGVTIASGRVDSICVPDTKRENSFASQFSFPPCTAPYAAFHPEMHFALLSFEHLPSMSPTPPPRDEGSANVEPPYSGDSDRRQVEHGDFILFNLWLSHLCTSKTFTHRNRPCLPAHSSRYVRPMISPHGVDKSSVDPSLSSIFSGQT